MRPRLLRPLSLALVAVCLSGPALADQVAQMSPDPNGLLAASGYTRVQKRTLAAEVSRALGEGVPREVLARLTAVCLARGVSAEHLDSFYQVLRRVRSNGLPPSIFENKIAEGLAKGASAELILQVVLEKERNYLRARQIIHSNVERRLIYDPAYYQVLELGAESLRRGLPPEGLARIFRAHAGSLREMGLAVRAYLYLQAIGFPLNDGLEIVTAALESGQFRECRTCLGQVIFSARRSGAPPGKIREELVRGMRSGRDLGEIGRVFYSAPQPPAVEPVASGDGLR
jgi:hypothetical protein